MSSSRLSRRTSTRCRPMNPVAPVTKYAIRSLPSSRLAREPIPAQPPELPAAGPVGAELLRELLEPVLALLELPLEERQEQDQQRKERDDDEARVRDHLVVGDAVRALAVVRGEGERGRDEEADGEDGEGGDETAHRSWSIRSMATTSVLRERVGDGVEVVRLDRPQVRNALDSATIDELLEALDELAGEEDLRVLVLSTTSERAFCAGADLSERLDHAG